MRYPAPEKLEIIRLVEQSHRPVKRTLEKLGIPRATFYRWYNLFQAGGPEALEDRPPRPDASGTASRMRSAGRSSDWRWMNPISRPVSWP
jgi:transposase-like protein